MTPSSPAPRTAEERAAYATDLATRAGRAHGLEVEQPRVLHNVFNVLVHLAPSPVVVRVQSLDLLTAEEHAVKQRDELAVAGWLADTGAPVVRPTPLLPREPVTLDGRSLTFWEYVTEDTSLPDEQSLEQVELEARMAEQAGWAVKLHTALADYPGELPLLAPLVPAVGKSLDTLASMNLPEDVLHPADLERARQEYAVLEELVADFPRYFPQARLRPLHGDSPVYNVLRTPDGGHVFNDFEDVTRGPVEWDLTLAGPRAVEEYERAGGRPTDPELLDLMEGARMLQGLSALTITPHVPEIGVMLQPLIGMWRARPQLSLSTPN